MSREWEVDMGTSIVSTQRDKAIHRKVLEELEWDSRIHANEVGVTVSDGVVTLNGRVASCAAREAAQEAAFHVRGVKAVANDVRVTPPSVDQRTDADLAQTILSVLRWDADIPGDTVEAVVSQGWVTLRGTVAVAFQRQQAERVVRHLIGVRGITNDIVVRTHTPGPADIKQRIARALVRNAETDARRIQVEVQGSTAILR